MVQSTRAWRIAQYISALGLDLVFPIECVGCGVERFHCCPRCQQRIRALRQGARCFECKNSWYSGQACPRCRANTLLPCELKWIGSYATSILKDSIYALKFGLREHIGVVLGQALADRCHNLPDCVVVPVPLGRRRLLERGFNQAGIIGEQIATAHGWNIAIDCLRRVRNTHAQAQLDHTKRAENIQGAFEWVGGRSVPERVLLVDDVWTTGSTMCEAIRVLQGAGVKEVYGAVVALG